MQKKDCLAIVLDKCLFFIIPFTFKSSTVINVGLVFTTFVTIDFTYSIRIFANRACNFCTLRTFLSISTLLLVTDFSPLFFRFSNLRAKERCSRFNRFSIFFYFYCFVDVFMNDTIATCSKILHS